MKYIELDFKRSTQFHPFYDSVSRITIEDEPFAGGGFGRLYRCKGFDSGQPPITQVAKIFRESDEGRDEHSWDTISKMQARIMDKMSECKSQGKDFLTEYPALIALPQLVFSGTLEGKTVRGYIANDLESLNYQSFKKILEEENIADFEQRDRLDKYRMCFHLAKAFRLFESINFIHADLSDDNIFISNDQPNCAIIDFDSGVVVENLKDNPSTWGKEQDWLAPEILFQKKYDNDLIDINIYSDMWAVCVAIHYLLLYNSPYLFLNELSENALKKYTDKNNWPLMDFNDPGYRKEYQALHEWQIDTLEDLPKEIREQFKNTFTKGVFKKTVRTTYYSWELIFKNLLSQENRNGQLTTNDSLSQLKVYLNDLICDIILHGENLNHHLQLIKSRVQKTYQTENDVLGEFTDFIELYNNVIADKKITKANRLALYMQGKRALLENATVDTLIAGYPSG